MLGSGDGFCKAMLKFARGKNSLLAAEIPAWRGFPLRESSRQIGLRRKFLTQVLLGIAAPQQLPHAHYHGTFKLCPQDLQSTRRPTKIAEARGPVSLAL